MTDLGVVSNMDQPFTLYCDNSDAVANSKEHRSHKNGKHIEHNHLIQEIVHQRDVTILKITFKNYLIDLFIKALIENIFEVHLEGIGLRDMFYLI